VLWDRVDAVLRERHEVSLAFFEALHFTSQAQDGSLRLGDLAKAIRITIGGASKLVDRVIAAGLLERLPDPHDRRAARIRLTREGARKLRTATRTYEETVAAFAEPVLSPIEQQQLQDYITRLLAAAQGHITE